jgi:Ser/Thr protein kinase RdoA (MazF antagonist)
MVNIEQENKKLRLDIQDYDGCSEEEIYVGDPSQRDYKKSSFNFQRKQSNHGYTSGEILSFKGSCGNNLIISTYESNFFKNIRNAFILANEEGVEISPISNIWNAIYKGNRILSGKINYSIPQRVLSRENLLPLDIRQLNEELNVKYGLVAEDINHLLEGRSKNGIYVLAQGKSKFILKYRGDNEERAESISQVLESIGDYFPRIFQRTDKTEGYTIKIGENYFGLEEFIEEKERPDLNIGYFPLLGNHMGRLHNSFSFFLSENPNLVEKLQRRDSFNEASIISIYLDLMKNNPNKHGFLVDSLDEILRKGFVGFLPKLPKALIHRDLNQSNIFWNMNDPKVVDSESIGIYRRLEEFIAPLLLGENMARPNYIKGSLERIVESYNDSINNSLSQEEENALKPLLKYSLLKYYVVRSVRRKIEDSDYLDILHKNLNEIGGRDD